MVKWHLFDGRLVSVATILLVGVVHGADGQPSPKSDADARDFVRQSLRSEMGGDNQQRDLSLAKALQAAPDLASANWHCGRLMNPGDHVHGVSGAMVVGAMKEMPSPPVVHNLIVEDFHTYFVGENGILVHDITYRQPTRALVPGLLDDSTNVQLSQNDR